MNSISVPRTAPTSKNPTATKAEEGQTFAAALRGDIAAFNQFVCEHQELAYRIAHALLDNTDSAVHATQDAFATAQRTLRQCPRVHFRLWFLEVLVEACRRRERAGWMRLLPSSGQATPIEIGLATIAFDDRVVCVLSDIVGLKDQEIGQVTKSSPETIREQRSRARRQLRDVILLL